MQFVKAVEANFWAPFILAMFLGLFIPSPIINLSKVILVILMLTFFFTCLKVDFFDVIAHIKKPLSFIYILIVYLLIIPGVIYLLFHFISSDLAIAFLLLSSMPSAMVSPVFTEFFKGNVSLSLALSLASHLIVPFSIPFLFLVLTHQTVQLDIASLFKTLILISFVPLGAAEIVKRIGKTWVMKTQVYYSVMSIMLVSFMIYNVVASQAKTILQNPLGAVIDSLWLCLLFFILFIIGYLTAFWRKRPDKIALAVSKSYMNMGPAIGLSVIFFGPHIALLMVLAEVPWNITLGPFKYLLKYLK